MFGLNSHHVVQEGMMCTGPEAKQTNPVTFQELYTMISDETMRTKLDASFISSATDDLRKKAKELKLV